MNFSEEFGAVCEYWRPVGLAWLVAFAPCQTSVGTICVALVLDPLFCSIELCDFSFVNAMLF